MTASIPYQLLRKLLFQFPPETAHKLALKLLKLGYYSKINPLFYKKVHKPINLFNITLDNPVGLAAGYDKNGDYIDALLSLGFGFIEIGTITPKPQAGNPKPRLFRLPKHHALINRMGFNNLGVDHMVKRLKSCQHQGIIGINIGKNATTPLEKASDDYIQCCQQVYAWADYITINISSPNTKGLRELQQTEKLTCLLQAIIASKTQLTEQYNKKVPFVVKLSPDGELKTLLTSAETAIKLGIDGIIATNTTVSRMGLSVPEQLQQGGLSGQALAEKSLNIVGQLRQTLGNEIPIIASGGMMDVEQALAMRDAGANAVQVYTGLVYQGPQLIREIAERF